MSWDEARKAPWKNLNSVESVSKNRLKAANKSLTASGSDAGQTNTHSAASAASNSGAKIVKAQPTILGFIPTAREFTWGELGRNVLFGVSVGGITGITFGFMDGMKQVQESQSLKSLSNNAKGSYIMRGCGTTGMAFAGFFSGFHAFKYGLRTAFDTGDYGQIGLGGLAALGGLGYFPENRRLLPYGVMLIAMDSFNLLFREEGNAKGLRPDGTVAGDTKETKYEDS
mmetsp:Transcript_18464/g.34271  ORF Transcript_18464/g.34271 Transcript_18464/m.34271 type:complete len:227 (-) Transcript_18464:19-699(-)